MDKGCLTSVASWVDWFKSNQVFKSWFK